MNRFKYNPTPPYELPQIIVLELVAEQAILSASGYGLDSDDSEFGPYFGY